MNYIPIFRGKYTDEFQRDKWIYGAYLKGGIYSITKAGAIVRKLIDKSTLGMSTGIKAEKSHRGESEIDRMLFDGDIVKLIYIEDGSESIHKIKWGGEEYPAFDFHPMLCCESNGLSFVHCCGAYRIEIIGNIHDNPEMLEA